MGEMTIEMHPVVGGYKTRIFLHSTNYSLYKDGTMHPNIGVVCTVHSFLCFYVLAFNAFCYANFINDAEQLFV